MDRLDIEGTLGEGGGQVLRTALALSATTGRAFRITRIRGGRSKPGLLRQHLTAVRAAAEVCGAKVEGAELGSRELSFVPGPVRHGDFHFAVGTAGSAPLVLQTAVTALLRAPGASRLVIEGGTENPHAPPSDFLVNVWAPRVRALGVAFHVEVERRGYYPAGGGRLVATLETDGKLTGSEVMVRGDMTERRALARVSALPIEIAQREVHTLSKGFGLSRDELHTHAEPDPVGPGNALMFTWRSAHTTEVFSGIGEQHKRAEKVATDLMIEFAMWEALDVPVGSHQADQLVLLFALAGNGRFRTSIPTQHLRTQLLLIPRFLPVACEAITEESGSTLVEVVS
jgi:RNA 3'-terminal phosphate cyclase (ATP)